MSATTGIEWTDATINFWWGCTKVGPGCDHCYAETISKRFGGDHWGTDAPRRKIKSAVKLMHRLDNDYSWWAADAHIAHIHPNPRRRVFVQSMSDLFDAAVEPAWFDEAWHTIEVCDRIDVQIVAKRLPNVAKLLAQKSWPKHAGLVATVVNQAEHDRDVPRLQALKRNLGIPWVGLSMEPLLGSVQVDLDGIDWIITGGESGPKARGSTGEVETWMRSIRDQCAAAGVAFFGKQNFKKLPLPDDLMIREFPT